MANGAFAASAASVDQGGDYAGRMLDRIIEFWAPPQALTRDARVRVRVSVDARGQLTACRVLAASGVAAFDASTCDAVRRSGSFGTPPYGAPMDVHMTFWNGTPRGKANTPGTENDPKAEAAGAAAQPQAATGAAQAAPPLPKKDDRAASPASAASSTPTAQSGASGPGTDKGAPPHAAPVAAKANASLPTYGEPGTPHAPTAARTVSSPASASRVAATGATASDKVNERYRRTVTRQLRAATFIPAETAPGEYRTRIALTISPQGEITDFKVLAPTGDKLLDKYVQRGIRRAGSLPPPPADLKGRLDITLTLVRR